ncbi:MAG: hypothetical protein O3A46_04505 [Candidatus Poribacteria bacterium]|nr:hypothetical protein [Candidatus Poribacteria bacterium]
MRRELYIALSVVFALGGLFTGVAWLALVSALVAWAALARVAQDAEDGSPSQRAVVGGAVAGLIVTVTDVYFNQYGFMFHVRREIAALPVSPGVLLSRSALFAACLFGYARLRELIGVGGATVGSAISGFALGWSFEYVGARSGLWVWNARHVPDQQIGDVWLFLPTAWGVTFLFSWYFLLPLSRRVPAWAAPLGSAVRLAAAYMSFVLIVYLAFVRLFGKVNLL